MEQAMEKALELMTSADLTPDLQLLADVLGMDTVKKILVNFSGINFYIPKISRLDSLVGKYMDINNTKSYNEIAKELNVSAQYLKNLVRKKNMALH